jgi:hypothetical protein
MPMLLAETLRQLNPLIGGVQTPQFMSAANATPTRCKEQPHTHANMSNDTNMNTHSKDSKLVLGGGKSGGISWSYNLNAPDRLSLNHLITASKATHTHT